MITLNIKRQDGSLYWSCPFPNRAAAESFLAEEGTRPYWKAEYTAEFITSNDIVEDPAIAVANAANDVAVNQAKVFLKGLKKSDLIDANGVLNNDKVATAIMKLVKYVRSDS